MDTEISLLEQMTKDDIETSFMSPVMAVMVYLVILYSVFETYRDGLVPNMIIIIIIWLMYQTYSKEFKLLMNNLCY